MHKSDLTDAVGLVTLISSEAHNRKNPNIFLRPDELVMRSELSKMSNYAVKSRGKFVFI